jgi:hypothetical protein
MKEIAEPDWPFHDPSAVSREAGHELEARIQTLRTLLRHHHEIAETKKNADRVADCVNECTDGWPGPG